eukprot:gene16181-biopygen12289
MMEQIRWHALEIFLGIITIVNRIALQARTPPKSRLPARPHTQHVGRRDARSSAGDSVYKSRAVPLLAPVHLREGCPMRRAEVRRTAGEGVAGIRPRQPASPFIPASEHLPLEHPPLEGAYGQPTGSLRAAYEGEPWGSPVAAYGQPTGSLRAAYEQPSPLHEIRAVGGGAPESQGEAGPASRGGRRGCGLCPARRSGARPPAAKPPLVDGPFADAPA